MRNTIKTIGKAALYTICGGVFALYVVATFMDARQCRARGGGYVDGLCLRPDLFIK